MVIPTKLNITGNPVHDGAGAGLGSWTVFLLCQLAFAFSLTCIYHGMRAVMRLGSLAAAAVYRCRARRLAGHHFFPIIDQVKGRFSAENNVTFLLPFYCFEGSKLLYS